MILTNFIEIQNLINLFLFHLHKVGKHMRDTQWWLFVFSLQQIILFSKLLLCKLSFSPDLLFKLLTFKLNILYTHICTYIYIYIYIYISLYIWSMHLKYSSKHTYTLHLKKKSFSFWFKYKVVFRKIVV